MSQFITKSITSLDESIFEHISMNGIEDHPRLANFHELPSENKLAGVFKASFSVALLA